MSDSGYSTKNEEQEQQNVCQATDQHQENGEGSEPKGNRKKFVEKFLFIQQISQKPAKNPHSYPFSPLTIHSP